MTSGDDATRAELRRRAELELERRARLRRELEQQIRGRGYDAEQARAVARKLIP